MKRVKIGNLLVEYNTGYHSVFLVAVALKICSEEAVLYMFVLNRFANSLDQCAKIDKILSFWSKLLNWLDVVWCAVILMSINS